MTSTQLRRAGRLAALLLIALPLGCDTDVEIPDYEPTGVAATVDALRVTIGTQSMIIYKDGRITLGPLTFVRPTVTITTELLDASGAVIPNVNPAELEVKMGQQVGTPNGQSVTFARTSAFGGTITTNNAGTSGFSFVLFDKIARRSVFGPYTVSLVVR